MEEYNNMKVSVIIPSLNPDNKLIAVVDALVEKGFDDIILVNDGSDETHTKPFKMLGGYKQCTVLTHEVNRGKGRGLKTAFEYCMTNRPDIDGVVTVDGDNQHTAEDIWNCCNQMIEYKDKVILGVRDFSGPDVPAKSRFGNRMTSFVFKFACGLNICDTQTGLRAIPARYLALFDKVKGERFEYETNMLLAFKQSNIDFVQVPIKTVYIEENASTHFNPIKDSIKIYGVILKYIFSSLASALIDLGIFSIVGAVFYGRLADSVRILLATVIARIISSLFNFIFNRKAVFKSDSNFGSAMIRYYALCVCQLLVSYGAVYFFTDILALGQAMTVVIKCIVDTILFIISFQIQRRWVFKRKQQAF